MESGSSAVYPESVFDPLALVRDLAGMAALQAETQGSMVEVTLGPDCVDNISVLASEQLFKNVVFNFIGNAVKFTNPPGVSVFYEATYGVTRQDIDILIEVRDHGPGIAEENLGRIFDNFETLDGSYARKNEGSGLGLGIAKRAADAMGGQISVTSRVGEGSTFSLRVRLPIARRRAVGAPEPASAEVVELFRPLNLLVVEDNEINRSILRETLISLGHEVVEAVDGREAVDLAKDTRFDGILMDISMPRMDGVEATKHIRAGGACRDVPIVGVTAHATPDQFRLFIDSGMNEVVVKPVRQSHLKRALNTIMRGRPAAAEEGAEPRVAPAQPDPKPAAPDQPLPSVNGELLDLELFESLREALGDDLLQQHFNTFLSESETAMGELRALTDEGDYANAARVAHKAAGAA
ncbi:MAG: response regulator, partial [Pseudomonadota bacterium]|nr:response regulator [Pseudomonadota bacterium]